MPWGIYNYIFITFIIWLILAYYFYATGSKVKQLEEKVKTLEEEKEHP